MNNTDPTTESALIERLISALPMHLHEAGETDFFLWEVFGKIYRAANNLLEHDVEPDTLCLRSNGVIYRSMSQPCPATGRAWKIDSHGLGAHLAWLHHTMPEQAADQFEIAQHIAEAVETYLKTSWPRIDAAEILAELARLLNWNELAAEEIALATEGSALKRKGLIPGISQPHAQDPHPDPLEYVPSPSHGWADPSVPDAANPYLPGEGMCPSDRPMPPFPNAVNPPL